MDQLHSETTAPRWRWGKNGQVLALVVGDAVALLTFAAIGRQSHGEAAGLLAFVEVVKTAAPFLLGWFLVAPLVGAYRLGSFGSMLRRSMLAWLAAWPVGLALRALFLSRGIPVSFAIVTLLTNTVILVGWRAVFAWVLTRRSR